MIIDHINNIEKYAFDKELFEALQGMKAYAQNEREIDSDLFHIMEQEYETKALEKSLLENHRKYIDIHYIVSGEEQILIDRLVDEKRVTDFSEEQDFELFDKTDSYISIVLKEGYFAVIYPGEGHAPKVATDNKTSQGVKKIMVKLRNDI